jgi:hypothetical protein
VGFGVLFHRNRLRRNFHGRLGSTWLRACGLRRERRSGR